MRFSLAVASLVVLASAVSAEANYDSYVSTTVSPLNSAVASTPTPAASPSGYHGYGAPVVTPTVPTTAAPADITDIIPLSDSSVDEDAATLGADSTPTPTPTMSSTVDAVATCPTEAPSKVKVYKCRAKTTPTVTLTNTVSTTLTVSTTVTVPTTVVSTVTVTSSVCNAAVANTIAPVPTEAPVAPVATTSPLIDAEAKTVVPTSTTCTETTVAAVPTVAPVATPSPLIEAVPTTPATTTTSCSESKIAAVTTVAPVAPKPAHTGYGSAYKL